MKQYSTAGISNEVADTLFITVYMRHLENLRPDKIISDPDASRIVEQTDYDFKKYDKATRSQIGTCIRVRHFDRLTREFIDRHEDPVVVSFGCGLDSRANRIGLDKGTMYNVDLPEVIDVRNKLLPPDERSVSLGRSLFDPALPQKIRDKHPDASFLVLFEGVLMYFPEEDVRPVLERIAATLSPGQLVFDACSPLGCRMSSKNDTVKHTKATFKWGLDDPALIERWAPNLSLNDVTYHMHQEKGRWDLMSRIVALYPKMAKSYFMLEYDMSSMPS
jgi:O-methyltransferase involved in polyketide biosynthesis